MDNPQMREPYEMPQQYPPIHLDEKTAFFGGCLTIIAGIWWIEVVGAILVGLYGLFTGNWPLFLGCLVGAVVGGILAWLVSLAAGWAHENLP